MFVTKDHNVIFAKIEERVTSDWDVWVKKMLRGQVGFIDLGRHSRTNGRQLNEGGRVGDDQIIINAIDNVTAQMDMTAVIH